MEWLLAKVFHRQILGFQKVSNFITMDSPHSKHSTQIVLKSFFFIKLLLGRHRWLVIFCDRAVSPSYL